MSTLLLRFAGPAQSWAGVALFPGESHSERVPTRSGLLGLLRCALGVRRGVDLDWLDATRAWARVDQPGTHARDYQTANAYPEHLTQHLTRSQVTMNWQLAGRAGGHAKEPTLVEHLLGMAAGKGAFDISTRGYLTGAEFIVALEHDTHLAELVAAARAPAFTTYLGRKAFSPTFPFLLGVTEVDAEQAMSALPLVRAQASSVELYPIVTDRNVACSRVTPPVVATRKEQLAWASTSLSR